MHNALHCSVAMNAIQIPERFYEGLMFKLGFVFAIRLNNFQNNKEQIGLTTECSSMFQ